MNTQLVKYLVVSILHVQVFVFAFMPSFAQASYSNSTEHCSAHNDEVIGFITETCPQPAIETLWRFNESDITPDRNIRWGVIEKNRMRYAIQKRPGPPSIRLLVDAGLVTEENGAQEGISDFLVKYFAFANQEAPFSASANTDFNGSVYSIDLPIENEALLDQALRILAAHFRGSILEEDNLDELKERLLNAYEIPPASIDDLRRTFIFSGSQLARKSTIKDLTPNREVLESFIQHWYSPDRAVLLITGDVTEDTHLKIEHYFSEFQAPPITYSTPEILDPEHSDMDAHTVLHPDANFARILFETIIRKPDNKDSKKTRRQALLNEIEETLMQERFIETSNQTDEIDGTCIRFYDHLNTLDIRKIRVTTSPQDWERAVEIAVDQLVRIVYKGGFSNEEFNRARQYVEETHKILAESFANTSNKVVADTFIKRVKKGKIPSSLEDDYNFTKGILKELSVEECNEELYKIWQTQQCYLIAEGNIGIDNQSEALDALTQAYLESAFSAVRKHKGVLEIPDHFTIAQPEASYPIAKTSTYEHLGLAQIRYENNFCLNIANSHSDTEFVNMAVRFGMGKLNEDLQRPGLGYLVEHIFLESGLAGFDPKTVQTLEQALGIELTFEMEEDAFLLRGKCPPQHTLTLLQLLFAYVTEPKLSPKAFELAKENYTQNYHRNLESPEGFMKLNGGYYLFTPGNLFKAPRPETVSQRTLQELKEWISPVIKESVFELSIVGSFEANDVTYITDALDHTFATLSPRKLETNQSLNIQSIETKPKNKSQSYTHEGNQDLWGARIAWPTCDGWSKLEARKLRILTEILDKRLHKALNLTFGSQYSNEIKSLNSLTYQNLGCIQSSVFNAFENAKETKEIILSEAQKLAEGSKVTFDEFKSAIKPLLDEFKNFSPKTSGLWEKEAIREHVVKKMQAIASKAMDMVNSNNITYEAFKKTMTSQVGSMKKAAHYKAALPLKQDLLESTFNELKAQLISAIQKINPNDLTPQETENITLPTIESLIKAKIQIEKTQGIQAQTNLKTWFREKTDSTINELKLLAKENGIDVLTPPPSLSPILEALQLAPLILPEDNALNFHNRFEAAATKQAERIQGLIDLINENEIHIYGDVSPRLSPYRSSFLQIAQNINFQKSTIKKLERTIQRKMNMLIDNAWELNPSLPNRDAVKEIISPILNELMTTTFRIQEHLDLEDLLDQSIETTLQDAWNVLNPDHLSPKELQDATRKLKLYLREKANTPDYWIDNVLIGSQFYPQKLDWAPHLISDYLEVDIEEISHTASKYLKRDHAYIIEILPEK